MWLRSLIAFSVLRHQLLRMQSSERAIFLAASAGRAHRVDNPCFAHRHLLPALNITNWGAYVQTGSRRADKFETVDFERERLRRTKEGLILSDRREKGAQVERETEGLGQLGLIEPQRNQ